LAGVADAGPRELIDACVQNSPDDDDTTGIKDLEAACPGLGAALDELGVGPLLSPSAQKGLTRESLTRLVELATPRPAGTRAELHRESLERILPTLQRAAEAPSWWSRLKAWLRSLMGGKPNEPGSSWLEKWLTGWTIPEAVASVLFFTLAGLVIALALGIIVNELRAAGVFGGRPAAARGSPDEAGALFPVRSLADVAGAPLERRAALMFELLVNRLSASGRLGAVRDRTHREIRSLAPFAGAADGERFGRLAAVAEEQLFSSRAVDAVRVQAALTDGEALIGALSAPRESRA